MSARHKLNTSAFLGDLLFAGPAGLIANSWLIFAAALAALRARSVHSGDIRLTPRR